MSLQEATQLTVKECRELLGEDGKLMSDAQIEVFRDALHMTVESILDSYVHTIVSEEI
jgi:hypothetical protein